jgi:hypothetical protein
MENKFEQQDEVHELKNYFTQADIVVLAETNHGTHFETIAKIFDQFLPQIKGVFFEIPVTYQSSFDLYFETGKVDEKLERFFKGAEAEGKNIRSLLTLLDKIKNSGKRAICIDSSKVPTNEYTNPSPNKSYFLRGKSRDEDMFENIRKQSISCPGKYLSIVGAAHAKKGKHHDSKDDTLGTRLTQSFSNKYTSILIGTQEAVAEEQSDDYSDVIIDKIVE